MDLVRSTNPPQWPLRCPCCHRESSRPVSISCHYIPSRVKRGLPTAVIVVLCPYCKATCIRLSLPCRLDLAQHASLAIQSHECELRYWPTAMVSYSPPVGPSILPSTPEIPITAEDVIQAHKQLKRTSFRRNSPSWGKFMGRLLDPPDPQ